jgi:hypothetical protein
MKGHAIVLDAQDANRSSVPNAGATQIGRNSIEAWTAGVMT